MKRFACPFIGLILLVTLNACAPSRFHDPSDPWAPYNRSVFYLNRGIDRMIILPITAVYIGITPRFMQQGVHHFFQNLEEITIIANDLLQFDIHDVFMDTSRWLINTTLGIGGLFDVATHCGFPYHENDLGLTFAHWGYRHSSYFVLPLLGPSTLRDTFGFAGEFPVRYMLHQQLQGGMRYTLYTLHALDVRFETLPIDPLINQAFDPYAFVRNAYLNKREKAVATVTKKIKFLKHHDSTGHTAHHNS